MPFDRSSEVFLLRQFLSPNYAQVAMLIGLLLVVIFRPERINLPGMFRLSCVLLAVSILVTPISVAITTAMMTISSTGYNRPGPSSEIGLLFSLVQIIEPILVALSICLGLFSLLPNPRRNNPAGPRQHPLDP